MHHLQQLYIEYLHASLDQPPGLYILLVTPEAHFTAVDLARIADQLDQEEAATLAEGSLGSLASFVSQPSPNMDDSGYFSGQVILSLSFYIHYIYIYVLCFRLTAIEFSQFGPNRAHAIINYA